MFQIVGNAVALNQNPDGLPKAMINDPYMLRGPA
jgi:hypothetical protein